jgi:hypothetical protein
VGSNPPQATKSIIQLKQIKKMKNNLIKALVLSLEYELTTYSTKDFSYGVEGSKEDGFTVTITVMASETGCFHGLQGIYSLIHDNLCSHAKFENGNFVITIF